MGHMTIMVRSSRGRPVRRRGSLIVSSYGSGDGSGDDVDERISSSERSESSMEMGRLEVPRLDICFASGRLVEIKGRVFD